MARIPFAVAGPLAVVLLGSLGAARAGAKQSRHVDSHFGAESARKHEDQPRPPRTSSGHDTRRSELRRFGLTRPTGKRTRRVAATTVLTEHPSSLRLMRLHLRRLGRLLDRPGVPPAQVLRFLEQPLMTTEKQVREFRRLSVEKGVATAKMIDYEGKPMPPSSIARYVRIIERAGLRPGIEGDRFLLLRLPGATETSVKDQNLRHEVFATIAATNLERVLAGKELPLDRLIVPDTQRMEELLEVHATYDQAAAAAVDAAVRRGKLPASHRAEVLGRLRRIQAVPLVEDANTVLNADVMIRRYLESYRQSFGETPTHLVVFVAGSDLNRSIGPVAGQIARTVMRSRLVRLGREFPEVDIIPWAGIGSGPMRSGVGRFPEKAAMLHLGMTVTVQPDQLDQPDLARTVAALGRSALKSRPRVMAPADERKLIAMGAIFADVHARVSVKNALPTVRLANLLAPLDQRGRKRSSANLFYEKNGEIYLRSVQAGEAGDSTTYGRTLDVSAYVDNIDKRYTEEQNRLTRRQRSIDRLWPKGLADPRAIPGAFARYIEGNALTTVAGLGVALQQAEASYGRRAVNRLRPFVTFLVKNDGFVLTRDRALVRQRIAVLHPELRPTQVERQVKTYFTDIFALERYLGQPLEQLVPAVERQGYEQASRKLYSNPFFVKYVGGQDLALREWRAVMQDLLPLVGHPGWNRIGLAPGPVDSKPRGLLA